MIFEFLPGTNQHQQQEHLQQFSVLITSSLLLFQIGAEKIFNSILPTNMRFFHLQSLQACVGLLALTISNASNYGLNTKKHVGEYIAETGFYQSLTLTDEEPILEKRSEFQDIQVMNSVYYGKVLILDGVIQLTEKDADSYNEMMVHPAMMAHPKPKRVLVIGGGDGKLRVLFNEPIDQDS